jgi:hypothetical protein
MGLRIPQNQIVLSKYTTGKEYIILSSYAPYQGYYYEINNKFFAGSKFNPNSPELIKINSNKVNSLLINSETSTYGKLSKTKIKDTIPHSYFFQKKNPNEKYIDRYFIQRLNIIPILIREISKESYEEFQTNPLYKSIIIKWNTIEDNITELSIAETQIPGITTFLEYLNYSPYSEYDEYPLNL